MRIRQVLLRWLQYHWLILSVMLLFAVLVKQLSIEQMSHLLRTYRSSENNIETVDDTRLLLFTIALQLFEFLSRFLDIPTRKEQSHMDEK